MMDFEDYLELGAIHITIAPDEQIPEYDPYYDDEYRVDCYLNDEAYLEAHISSLYGEEVKL